MTELQQTPLHALHLELQARMVPFAGYEMPVQYPLGLFKEHQQTRESAGLFDVSHMCQVRLEGANAASAMEKLVPVDVIGLEPGSQRYAFFTNDQGGILDDFMITNAGDHLFVVVNAACKEQDIELMRNGLGDDVKMEVLDRALIAIQGPAAASVLARFAPDCADMLFMTAKNLDIDGISCYASRSGYTGEDGYEISIPVDSAEHVARLLLSQPEVEAIGLGARDSLRLEVGLCLYGHDLDTDTTPVESALLWALSKSRRVDGERAGGYPGADIVHQQHRDGVERKRIGLRAQGKAPVREGSELVDADNNVIGQVTSGSFGPTVGLPVAMGYLKTEFTQVGTEVFAVVRGKPVPMSVAKLPFVPQRYHRG